MWNPGGRCRHSIGARFFPWCFGRGADRPRAGVWRQQESRAVVSTRGVSSAGSSPLACDPDRDEAREFPYRLAMTGGSLSCLKCNFSRLEWLSARRRGLTQCNCST